VFSARLRKTVTGMEKQSYDYGYQRGYDGRWFACPYLLVQVTRAGRIPERELEKYKRRVVAAATTGRCGGARKRAVGAEHPPYALSPYTGGPPRPQWFSLACI